MKFCPKCHSANYATSSICRKCGYEFDNKPEDKIEENIPIKQDKTEISPKPSDEKPLEISPKKPDDKEEADVFLFYIDFINLDRTFEKYNKEEFKQKVIQNIKTTVKIVFKTNCDFVTSRTVMFRLMYSKKTKLLNKINYFEAEFKKFNQILEKTLDCGISYKFIITTEDEVRSNGEITQLKLGSDGDVIVSNGCYSKLNSELSLIKISPDSYKMVFLDQKPVFEQSEDEKYDKALEIMLNNLADNNSKIRAISLNAPRGAGKTHLLNDLYYRVNRAKLNNTAVFYSQCSALTQISPYGLIQNLFSTLFECPNILAEDFNIKSFEKKVLEKLQLEKIDDEALETLANLIYPIKKDYFENILINKEITYKYLKDIFDYIKQKKNLVFIIDDFDLIDESSYGFLKHLVVNDYFEHDAKLVLGYKNQHSIAIYFQSNKLNNNNCLNISLRQYNIPESQAFIKKVLGQNSIVPSELLSQIAYNAKGNLAYIEQILQYLFERKILTVQDKAVKFKGQISEIHIPPTLEECFVKRLEFLKEQNQKEYVFLNVASLLGDKLDCGILSEVFSLSRDAFYETVKRLEKRGYLKRKYDDVYGFKNSLTWSYCYIRAKDEILIKNEAKKLLSGLNNKVISTPLICPILAQIIENKELAFNLWTRNLQFASYIGDLNIYAMAQKQSLILLESIKTDNFEYIKNNICERLGKLVYTKSPAQARDYLTNAIASAQKNNNKNKVIDLSGYLVKSEYLTQDYTGVVEVADNILKYFNKSDRTEKKNVTELQIALIKTRKLQALLKLGQWEEISSIVNTEINPTLQKHLNFFSKHKWISQNEIFYSWIESNIILAQSYAQQGSPLAFELIDEIDKVLSKEKGQKTDELKLRLEYASAMAYTSRGYFEESQAILGDIIKDYSYVIDTPDFCEWNIINIINKVLSLDLGSIKEELFEAAAYANNANDEFSKNILKTLLAYVFLEEKSYLKALGIATEEMQYFSSKKIAFGALLAWYISAAATASNKADMYCIEICEKAVKICENAQNNNNYFKILFQELLAKSYLKLNDKENAQMYCDLALQSAITNELTYLQVRLNSLKATIARERMTEQPNNKKYDYAQNIIKLYNRTIDSASRLNLKNHIKKLEKDLTSFRAYCQLNRIIEDK